MNLAEIVVVSIGLSLDVFAVTACEGAMLAEVEKKKVDLYEPDFLYLAAGRGADREFDYTDSCIWRYYDGDGKGVGRFFSSDLHRNRYLYAEEGMEKRKYF